MDHSRLSWNAIDVGPFFGGDRRFAWFFWASLVLFALVLPVAGTIAVRNLALFGMLAVALATLRRQRHWPIFPLWNSWLIYAATALLSISYAKEPAYSLAEIRVEILYSILVFLLGVNVVRGEAVFRQMILVLCLGNVFLVAFSLSTAASGGTTKDDLVGTVNTGVGNFSTYLITIMPFIAWLMLDSWRNKKRLAWILLALLLADLLALVLTLNRQGIAALVAESAVIGVWALLHSPSRRSIAMIAVAMALLGALFVNQYQARDALAQQGQFGLAAKSDIRWHLWRFTVDGIADHPCSGSGFGLRAFKLMYPGFESESMLWHAHNMVLNKGVQMGLPGIASFLLLFVSVFLALAMRLRGPPAKRAIALACLAMALGVFVKNMTDDFFFRELGYLFWLLVGAALGTSSRTTDEQEQMP